MKLFLPFILGMIILAQSCTGQKPAELRNATTPRNAVKASCSSMVFEGQVLSKKNIVNIFDCSGWGKKYPDLDFAIKNADAISVDKAFKIFNDTFFSTKRKRKAFFELVANAEARGEMKTLAMLFQKGLADHKILTQVNKALNNEQLTSSDRSVFMKVLSQTNTENVKIIRALKNVGKAYEIYKPTINNLLSDEDKEKLLTKIGALFGDFSQSMDNESWKHLSNVIHDGDSPIQKWAIDGVNGDLSILLNVIEDPEFYNDVSYLKKSLTTGIKCTNQASTKDFNINIGQELKHKIESLKTDNKEAFEKMLLHGLTKYLAFQGFCEEKVQKQGVNSFYMVLKHAFSVLPSSHDFNFLKRLHQVFDKDRFVFLSFLSSNSFSALRDLMIELKADGRDEQLVRSLYETMAELSSQDLITASELVNEITVDESKTKLWYRAWGKLWDSLAIKDKRDFISFLGVFLDEKINASDALNFIETIIVEFPEFTPALAKNLTEDTFQESIRYIIKIFSQDKAQEQLSLFLSDKGLFEFIEIMTQEYAAPKAAIAQLERNSRPTITYVESPQTIESVQTRACFAELTKKYETDSSYYNLVNTLPETCLTVLGQVGFVGQIYLWMNSSEAYFQQHYQVDDFHSGTGVWSPGMLQFIFSSAVKADFVLKSKNGKQGIKENIDEIHRVLTDPRLLETFHQFSSVYGSIDQKINLDSKLLNFVNSKSDNELNQITSDGFKLLKKAEPYVNLVIRPVKCEDIPANLGANPCMTIPEQSEGIVKIFRVLKRKNEADNSLIKELINWIHPAAGIELPFRKIKTRTHQASIDEMIRFLYDLSSEQTVKPFTYYHVNRSEKVSGTVIDRLEIIIRDIGFLNNFYGSYFKNMVASAVDYRKDVIEAEKLLKLLDGSGGIFRGFNTLPDDSKHRLKNARQTYDSLIDLSDNYIQADGSQRSYGPFIQSLLAAIGESSKVSTHKFNAYRVPKSSLVDGHNGVFLTHVVEMSALRHLSSFVRARFDTSLSALNSEDFKMINTNLIGRHDLSKLQTALQTMLDKYLDNDRNQLNIIIDDMISFMATLKSDDQKEVEEIALKTFLLLSDKRVSTANIEKVAQLVELAIEMWPELRKVVASTENSTEFLKLMNNLLDSLIRNPAELNRIAEVLTSSDLFSADELRDLLNDKDFVTKISNFINQLVSLHDFDAELNWGETFEAMFSPSDTQWEALKDWFQIALGEKEDKLTLSLLISFLGEKKPEGYRLKGIMDELFLNHRPELEQFLSETFKSLEFKPD
jgi:hypothetical protein